MGVIHWTECTWPGYLAVRETTGSCLNMLGIASGVCLCHTDIDRNNHTSSKSLRKSQMYGDNMLKPK